MNSNYAEIVWILNAVLVALVVLLGAGGLIHSVAAAAAQRRRQPADTALTELFHKLDGQPALTIAHQLTTQCSHVTAERWIWLINRHETFIPEGVWPHLEAHLFTTPVVAEIEQQAGPGNRKWPRIEALKCLGHLHTPLSLTLLEQALSEKDEDLRYFAMLSLAHMRTATAARVILDQLQHNAFNGHKVVALLEAFPPAILPDIYAALKKSDTQARFWLLKLLARFKVVVDLPDIGGYTSDPSPDVRAAACECLGFAQSLAAARGPLMNCLLDPVWYVRLQAVRGLAHLCGASCLPQLAGLMNSEQNALVQESIKNVLLRNAAGVLPATELFLDRENQTVKEWCVNALVDSNSVVRLLLLCLSDEATEREHARVVLKKLIASNIHFGLKQALDQLQAGARQRVLEFVAGVDALLAQRMETQAVKGA
ncbi:MAG: HEAT repeat domain-containing protein [Kiritimatiellaeota bacterium]|nr:HEAT repeat domain-containing protein [Kiritimatiellota bacterium]